MWATSSTNRQTTVWIASAIGLVSITASVVLILRQRAETKRAADDSLTYARLTEQEEQFLSMGIGPISTATWFEGDPKDAARFLQDRVGQIVKANPWLAGKFAKKQGRYQMAYKSDTSVTVLNKDDAIFQLGEISDAVHSGVPFEELAKLCSSWILQIKKDFQQPFWKVVLLPCIGESKVSPLTIERNHSTKEQQQCAMGSAEAGIMSSTGLIVSILRGIFLSFVVAPTFGRQDLRVSSRFLLVDEKVTASIKSALSDKSGAVPFISRNDIITSWFLRNCQRDHGLMALNFRGRLKGHTDDMAGNYESCLYYRKEDMANPVLIRESVRDMKRAVTKDRSFSSLDIALDSFAIITNWASFLGSSAAESLPGCLFLAHFPIIDVKVMPCTMAMCVIFQARPNQLGLLIEGTPDVLERLTNAPFEKEETFAIL